MQTITVKATEQSIFYYCYYYSESAENIFRYIILVVHRESWVQTDWISA